MNLAVNYNLGNGSRLEIGEPRWNDKTDTLEVWVELRRNNATDVFICGLTLYITNTQSTRIARQVSPPTGVPITDLALYFTVTSRGTPTGYDDMVNAWRSGSNKAARRAAFEAALYTGGHIDPVSLAAT